MTWELSNMIELAWAHLKRVTTKKKPLKTHKEVIGSWTNAWRDLEQSRIQAWIKCIVNHLEKVQELEGGNQYREGQEQA